MQRVALRSAPSAWRGMMATRCRFRWVNIMLCYGVPRLFVPCYWHAAKRRAHSVRAAPPRATSDCAYAGGAWRP